MSGKSMRLRDDWMAMLRLSADVAALPADGQARRRHILSSLCSIVGACAGIIFEVDQDPNRTSIARRVRLVTADMVRTWWETVASYLYSLQSVTDTFNRRVTPALLEHQTVVPFTPLQVVTGITGSNDDCDCRRWADRPRL